MVKKSATNDRQERNAHQKHSSHAGSRPADAHAAAHTDYISKSAVHCEDVSTAVKHHNADMSQGAPQKEKKKKRLIIPPVRPSKPPGYKKGPQKSSSGRIPNAGQKLAMYCSENHEKYAALSSSAHAGRWDVQLYGNYNILAS
ncbi:hypothetical protein DFH29DRAFT_873833 [Suillus ampliporus]|nr:hypothetical protein DFH29DRAFT_873833 [Suillus ampliporus]